MHSGFAAILRSLKMSSICLKFLKLSSKQTLNPTPQMCPQYKYRKYKYNALNCLFFASNGFSQYSFQNQLLKSILDSYLRVKKGFEKGKCYIWYICVNEKGSLSAIRHWDDKDKDPTNTIVFEKLCLRRHLYFFRIPPPPHPHVGGNTWESFSSKTAQL